MAVVEQTKKLPLVRKACIAKITIMLPRDKFPKNYPYGPDVDNLLKRFLDVLNSTVFTKAKGRDSCILSLALMKAKVSNEGDAGALLEILLVKP